MLAPDVLDCSDDDGASDDADAVDEDDVGDISSSPLTKIIASDIYFT